MRPSEPVVAARKERAVGMGATAVQLSVVGVYASTVLRSNSKLKPPMAKMRPSRPAAAAKSARAVGMGAVVVHEESTVRSSKFSSHGRDDHRRRGGGRRLPRPKRRGRRDQKENQDMIELPL